MRDIMIDVETLGTAPGSVILSIGAVEFNIETGQVSGGGELYAPIDATSAQNAGLSIDAATVCWWSQQSDEARRVMSEDSGAMPLLRALAMLSNFVSGDTWSVGDRVWSKGPSFDMSMLEAAYRVCGTPAPWSHRQHRDVRTILDLATSTGWESPAATDARSVAHNALSDARDQAVLSSSAWRHITRRSQS